MTTGNILLRDVIYYDSGAPVIDLVRKSWAGEDDPEKKRFNRWWCLIDEASAFVYKDPYGNILSSQSIGHGYGFPRVPQFPTIDLVNELDSRVRDSNFNGVVFLYELDESIFMLKDKIMALFRFIKDIKRGSFGKALNNYKKNFNNKTAAEELSGRWLEFYYGWLPLIQDITDLISALENYNIQSPPTISVEYVQLRNKEREYYSDDYFTYEHTWRTGWNVSSTVRSPPTSLAGALGIPDFPYHVYSVWNDKGYHFNGTITEDFSQMTTRMIEGFWNILPFSFVIDWFYDVGDYLSALGSFDKLEVQQVYYTIKHSLTIKPISTTVYGSLLNFELLIPNTTDKLTYYERGVLADLTLSPPTIDLKFHSLQHAYNASALITTVLPKTRR